MTDMWNANVYIQFIESRTRPARDLLAAIPHSFMPRICYDLGSGPGNSTILLKERFSSASIIGVDTSADMLLKARKTYPDITFVQNDIATFAVPEKADLLFANASLHWLDRHDLLLKRLSGMLTDDGMLAFQIPNNFHAPTHQIPLAIFDHHSKWSHLAKALCYGRLEQPLYNVASYYDHMINAGFIDIQCWETYYFQEIDSLSDIFDWIKGTGLRPVLCHMKEQEQKQFSEIYIESLYASNKYQTQVNGKILFPYQRLFVVGQKRN